MLVILDIMVFKLSSIEMSHGGSNQRAPTGLFLGMSWRSKARAVHGRVFDEACDHNHGRGWRGVRYPDQQNQGLSPVGKGIGAAMVAPVVAGAEAAREALLNSQSSIRSQTRATSLGTSRLA